jgi:SAM-dependent methyltransferase
LQFGAQDSRTGTMSPALFGAGVFVTDRPDQIVDTQLLIARKRRAVHRGVAGADFLMQRAGEDLGDRLATVGRRFARAAALFCVTPAASDAVLASGKADDVLRVEADPAFLGGEDGVVARPGHVAVEPASLDLAVSLLSLQDENDVPGMLIQIRRALRPDGLFLAAFPGAGTLNELRDSLLAAETELYGGASPRVIPFTDVRDAGALL